MMGIKAVERLIVISVEILIIDSFLSLQLEDYFQLQRKPIAEVISGKGRQELRGQNADGIPHRK